MQLNPKLSIIVPVYNIEKYIEKCILSILNQSITDFELILINDGSIDGSPQICDKYATLDNRVKVIHQENTGVSSARNAGLTIAQGEFIGFVDGDDYIESNMYESIIKEMEKSGVDIGICGYDLVYDNKIEPRRYFGVEGSTTILSQDDTLMESIKIPSTINFYVCNKVFRKEIINGIYFSREITIGEDADFFLRVSFNAKESIYISTCFYHYLQRDGSAMHSDPAKKIELFYLTNLIFNDISKFKPHILDFALRHYVDIGFTILNLAHQTQDNRFDYVINQIKRGFIHKLDKILKCKEITINQKILILIYLANPRIYHLIIDVHNRKN